MPIRDIKTWPAWLMWAVVGALTAAIGWADAWTGSEISVGLFYLLPVLAAGWRFGRRGGALAALLATAVEGAADWGGGRHDAHWMIGAWNTGLRLLFLLAFVAVLGELKRSLAAEAHSARTDFLTGAANGRAFTEAAENEINRGQRYGRPYAVVYMDLDGFKQVNDTLGHHVGDQLLRAVADTIHSSLRVTDHVARLGGDEFVMLLPESDLEPTRIALQRLRDRLTAVMAAHSWPVTFSLGVAIFRQSPASVDEMLRRADRLLYAAKNGGKNRMELGVFG